jgi:hypothetical protein
VFRNEFARRPTSRNRMTPADRLASRASQDIRTDAAIARLRANLDAGIRAARVALAAIPGTPKPETPETEVN